MFVLMLLACGGALDPDDVRSHLDSPTARLSSANLPQLADDLFAGNQTRLGEANAWLWSGQPSRVATTQNFVEVRSALDVQYMFGLGCALSTLASFDEDGDCDDGNCEISFTFRACLLDDELADGRIDFSLTERNRADFDRTTLELDYRHWQTTLVAPNVAYLDGTIAVEATDWVNREELLYTADFVSSILDTSTNTTLEEARVRGALRIVADGDTNSGSVEVLGWVDSDGDGREDDSVKIILTATALDDGSFLGFTFDVVDATGTWSCTYSIIERSFAGDIVYTSVGSCVDPSGDEVTFDGVSTGL